MASNRRDASLVQLEPVEHGVNISFTHVTAAHVQRRWREKTKYHFASVEVTTHTHHPCYGIP